MIAVPFIYFSILFVAHYSRNGRRMDMACFIYALYAISGLLGIIRNNLGYHYWAQYYEISPGASLTYCGLLTLCSLPFAMHSKNRTFDIKQIKDGGIIKKIAWFSFSFFLIVLFLSYKDIVFTLTSEAVELRGNVESSFLSRLNPIVKFPIVLLNYVFGAPWILQFLAFYAIVIQKLPMRYFLLLSVASLLTILYSIIGVDRSGGAYWILSFIACTIFFKPLFSPRINKVVKIFFIVLSVLAFLYFASITISRFGKGNDGIYSVIDYLGQPYVNFCYLFDHYTCPDETLNVLFPFSSKFLFDSPYKSAVALQRHLSLKSGMFVGVFYTFLGHIMVSSNIFVASAYSLLFFFFGMSALKKRRSYDIFQVYVYLLFGSVMFLGLFGHYYSESTLTFSILFWAVFLYMISKGNKNPRIGRVRLFS